MAESKIVGNKTDIVLQYSKIVYLNNERYSTVLTLTEIEELLGHTIKDGLNKVSVYVYNGDWDAINFQVTSVTRQKNYIIAFYDQTITHNVRLNFIIVVKRDQSD